MNIDLMLLVLIGLRGMAPIALTAIGEAFSERAGVVNIGLEGIILLSAFGAVVGGEFFMALGAGAWTPWLGMFSGMLFGALFGLIHGFIGIYMRGDQIISGVGINLFALGLVGFGLDALWNVKGSYQYDLALRLPGIQTPVGNLSYIILATFALAFFTYWMLNKTAFGLRVKAVGENPEAADIAGISVERTRMIAVVYGAALGGLAGAFLSLDVNNGITENISAGRGFIALATVVFSKLNPLLALVGGLIFGLAQVLSTWIKSFVGPDYFYFVQMIPYVVTLLVVAGAIGRARFPAAIAQPYKRE